MNEPSGSHSPASGLQTGRFAKHSALLRSSWPFLATIATSLVLALSSMMLMSAGRAYVSGESLWSKAQKNAVLHLADYARTCDAADYARYQSELAVTLGDRAARLTLSSPYPDVEVARAGFLAGRNHPSDIDGMIFLFRRLGHIGPMREAIHIWSQADALMEDLRIAAEELRSVIEKDCHNTSAKEAALVEVLALNEGLTPLQRSFSDTVGEANRFLQVTAGAALLALTVAMSALGAIFTRRAQRRQEQAQMRLAESEERFQLAVSGSRQGLFDLDVESGRLFVSPELEDLLLVPRGQFGNHRRDVVQRLHPLERGAALQELSGLIAKGQPFDMELQMLDGNGAYRWIRLAGRAQGNQEGRATRVLGSVIDISARKALEQELLQQMMSRDAAIESLRRLLRSGMKGAGDIDGDSGDALADVSNLVRRMVEQLQRDRERLNAVFTLSPDGFASFDADGRITLTNLAFTRLTGLSEAAVMGLDMRQLEARLAAAMVDGTRRPNLTDVSAEGGRQRIELQRPVQRVLEIAVEEGSQAGISKVMVVRDVTHETEVERLKSEFLSTAAHELRTPMASISGFAELLMLRSYPAEKQTEMLRAIHRQSNRMAHIIDELLDLARIEARRGKDFLIERVRLCSVVDEAVEDLAPPAGRQKPEWTPPLEPVWVDADRGKLLQAVVNVLANAYKYSPDGGPVRVALVDDPGSGARGGPDGSGRAVVGVRITDQGIGLKPEQLARVGERFYRADTSGRFPGSGLGVTIVREILQLLGGWLELQSDYGQGTEVTLWIPRADDKGV